MDEASSFGEMWERASRGDRDAQADLYLEFGPHLRRIIRLKLRDLNITWAVEPDDLLDSFFVRLYTGGSKISIKDALHFTNYCEKALRNRCVRVLRSTIRRLATRIDDCPPDLLAEPDTTSDEDSLEWAEQLETAYARLTQRERIICLLELEGFTSGQIGERLNISAAAAGKAHSRAAVRVRDEVLAQKANASLEKRKQPRAYQSARG